MTAALAVSPLARTWSRIRRAARRSVLSPFSLPLVLSLNRAAAANAGLQSGGAVTLAGHTRARHGTDLLSRSGYTRATGAIRMNMAAASFRSTRRLRSPSSPRASTPRRAARSHSPRSLGAQFKFASRQYLLIGLGYTHVPARYNIYIYIYIYCYYICIVCSLTSRKLRLYTEKTGHVCQRCCPRSPRV